VSRPDPAPAPWPVSSDGAVTPVREAVFWRPKPRKRVRCDLCFRACTLEPGQVGWCKYRGNENGAMALLAHGVLSTLQRTQSGYSFDPFWSYKIGEPGLAVGTTHCTSACSFCMSTTAVWSPERLPWVRGRPWGTATDGGHAFHRAILHPAGVVEVAQRWGCRHVCFTTSEATLSYEYTLDTALLAKKAGLGVRLLTNGFSPAAVVRRLAPVVDAVYFGVKGSADPEFYRRWMRSEGSVPTVLAAAKAWRDAGVHLMVSDLVPPQRMQADATHEAARDRLYAWVAAELGPDTPTDVLAMLMPGPLPSERLRGLLLPADATQADADRYLLRVAPRQGSRRAGGAAVRDDLGQHRRPLPRLRRALASEALADAPLRPVHVGDPLLRLLAAPAARHGQQVRPLRRGRAARHAGPGRAGRGAAGGGRALGAGGLGAGAGGRGLSRVKTA
jgi:pyruvate formate lyase activating enzyme